MMTPSAPNDSRSGRTSFALLVVVALGLALNLLSALFPPIIPEGFRRPNFFVVSGRTKPNKAGHTVWLYRGRSAHGAFAPPDAYKHVLLGKSVVRENGRYRIPVRFEGDGRKRLFVDVSAGDGNVRGYSDYLKITVH